MPFLHYSLSLLRSRFWACHATLTPKNRGGALGGERCVTSRKRLWIAGTIIPGFRYRCYMKCLTIRTTTAVRQTLSFHFSFQRLQYQISESCGSRCWIWNLRRPGLLAGQELLGDWVGNGRLRYDDQEQKQPVWNCYKLWLSASVGTFIMCDTIKVLFL